MALLLGTHALQAKKATCQKIIKQIEVTERNRRNFLNTDKMPTTDKDSVRSLPKQG